MIIKLDRKLKTPLYIQIKNEIKKMILSGKLKAHEKLPPTREFARSLNIGRNTVVRSYSLLEAEGMVYSKTGKGTFINPRVIKNTGVKRINKYTNYDLDKILSTSWKRIELSLNFDYNNHLLIKKNIKINFNSPEPDKDIIPIDKFKDSLINAIKRYGSKIFSSLKPEGFEPFREYLSNYMIKRGIFTSPECILITSGIQQGLSLIAKLLLDPGDTVVLEDLTYPGALSVFRSMQTHCIGIPTDKNGLNTEILHKILKRRKIKLLYTIPTYHNPLGIVQSLERRKKLLELSREFGFIIIEDDYAHELSFTGSEEIPIKSFDSSENVFYLGSFSETLFPGIRLSWIIAPENIINKLSYLKYSSDLYTNLILQAAVLDFMEKGYFDKHIKKLNNILAKRNETINYAITRYFPQNIKSTNIKGGPYRWIDLPSEIDSLELLSKCKNEGVLFAPDRLFAVDEWNKNGFRIKFSNTNRDTIWKGIEIIGNILKVILNK